ncbi:hypothetical protein VZ94_01955 [Methylocucumis oryzae]|uniref:Uncharacterized protein n=2 Tax=Methylocucumis oryzae TaxID=1632867 RepID=A0A0F3IMB7_9GAMM|nr:hypothetical protein VZ94_01955 [Methylocucumis oryzae]
MPALPTLRPNAIQQYFNYGRSVESKLRYMVRDDKESTAPIAYAGWIGADQDSILPIQASGSQKILIAAYGQSFTFHLLDALHKIDPRFELNLQGGPAAPLAHSYALFEKDSTHKQAKFVVLGVLASSLPRNVSPTTMTTWFEAATPYNYPRYYLEQGQLKVVKPFFNSLDELRNGLKNSEIWEQYKDFLRVNDPAYHSYVFDTDVFDYSALGRLIRRGYSHKHVHEVNARYWDERGFKNTDGLLDVSNALIKNFAQQVRKKGQIPLVLLLQDRGYEDHLVKAFQETLTAHNIPYFSSHDIAPSSDLSNFISDGHFKPEIDIKLATALNKLLLQYLAN